MDTVQAMVWVRLGIAAVVAGQSMVFGIAVNLYPPEDQTVRLILHAAMAVASVIVFALVGGELLRRGWAAALDRKIVVEQLFLVGVMGAFVASVVSTVTGEGDIYYEVTSILLAIYTFGIVVGDSRRQAAWRAAAALETEYATCRRVRRAGAVGTLGGPPEEVAVAQIQPGDVVRVATGEGIAVDGRVLDGVAFVRQMTLTGEPQPVVKRPGDPVFAGTTALDASLLVEATAPGHARQLDALFHSIDEARRRPSRWQREADAITSWFLPVVLLIAAATFAWWISVAGWAVALFNSMAVLLVACPCALGLATPIAIWSSLNALAARGIRATNADFVEVLARVGFVAFDKTGTLSEEELRRIDFVSTLPDKSCCSSRHSWDKGLLRQVIGQIQSTSHHPIARAFHDWAPTDQPPSAAASGSTVSPASARLPIMVESTEVIPGVGLRALVSGPGLPSAVKGAVGAEVLGHDLRAEMARGSDAAGGRVVIELGNDDLLDRKTDGPDASGAPALRDQLADGVDSDTTHRTWVRLDGQVVGLAVLRESLRPTSSAALRQLETLGVGHTVMTGDRAESAASLGLPVDHAGLSPEDKARLVRQLQEGAGRSTSAVAVLFVGDGVNDAPAMAQADAAIALSGGAGLARETAGAQMFGTDLRAIPSAISLARRVRTSLRSNLLFASCYNAVGMGAAALGYLHPVVAALIMMGSSLTVTVRALQLDETIRAEMVGDTVDEG